MKKRILAICCMLCVWLTFAPGVPALEGEARRAADTLITLGLLDEGEYDLSAPVDRVAATVMLVKLSGGPDDGVKSSRFRDVPKEADAAVAYAVRQGWITGVSATAFGVEQRMMANDWFAMLLKMLDCGAFEASDAAIFARRIGLVSRAYTGLLTLGDLCESATETLVFAYPDGQTVIDRLIARGICAQSDVDALGLKRPELTARQIADRHMSGVFRLKLYDTEESIDEADVEEFANASGFFIRSDGLAVTNYHSIDGATHAVATLVTGEQCPISRVIWYDVGMDLAIIRVSRTTLENRTIPRFHALQIVGTTDLRAGDIAYALSNPLGYGLAVSAGVISATSREVDRYSIPCVMNTADISQGSSGGALLNVFGHVIAVTSGAYRLGNAMYLAVPADVIPTLDLDAAGYTLPEVVARETPQERQTPEPEEEPEASLSETEVQ